MLTGRGEQLWMRNKAYEQFRKKALEDRYKFTDEELEKYEVYFPQGTGRTKSSTYKIRQFPFPVDGSIRQRKVIDIRKVPRLGID